MEKQKKSTFTYGVRYFLNQIEIEENEIYFFNLMIQQSADLDLPVCHVNTERQLTNKSSS